MDNTRKRPRKSSDSSSGSEAQQHLEYGHRTRGPVEPSQVHVGHADASGLSRMHVGAVNGDNIHGSVNHYYHTCSPRSGDAGSRLPASGPRIETTDAFFPSQLEKKEMIDRLKFSQLDARLYNLRKAQGKTCAWLLQRKDYKEWRESDNLQSSNGFFWIKGNPGTGKSIAMKFLFQEFEKKVRRAKKKHKLVLSFFFNARGNDLEKSTLGLYRSLLHGLFSREPTLQEDALAHCQGSGYDNILQSGWQLQMLKEVFEEAVLLLQNQEKCLYCYVDALDECPENDVRDMISYFEDLVSKTESKYFRVCFSSRHYPQISIRTK